MISEHTINIPAPEETRTWGEYVKMFKRKNHPSIDIKDVRTPRTNMTLRDWFVLCWAQDEAESIHAAFNFA